MSLEVSQPMQLEEYIKDLEAEFCSLAVDYRRVHYNGPVKEDW